MDKRWRFKIRFVNSKEKNEKDRYRKDREIFLENILEALGEDKRKRGAKRDSKEVAQSYGELFSGLLQDPKDVLQRTFTVDRNDLIVEKNIDFHSMWSIVFYLFIRQIDVAYIPNGKIVGFGDIIKAIDILAKRPQIQERLCAQLADAIYETLDCKVYYMAKAKHMCMTMRGEKRQNSEIITTAAEEFLKQTLLKNWKFFL